MINVLATLVCPQAAGGFVTGGRLMRLGQWFCIIALAVAMGATTGCSDDPDGGSVSSSAGSSGGGATGSICKATDDCPCNKDSDCESGVCIEGPDGNKVCGKPCGDKCPDDWECKNFSTADKAIFVCVPSAKPTCVPAKEICDGEDNDCDGKTDETFCDDGNPCTDDVCDPKLAVNGSQGCTPVNINIPCDDNDLCTTGDVCNNGACQKGTTKACDDGSPCTKDSCDQATGGCVNEKQKGPCTDGTVCTKDDECDEGKCVPGKKLDCDDGNPCTDDACDPIAGCTNSNNAQPCEDGDLCTPGDACKNGKCKSADPVDCDDGDPCTKNFCDPALVSDLSKGCTLTWVVDVCDDGDGCTAGDFCHGGKCKSGAKKHCDDGKVCTVDTCNESGDCQHNINPGDLSCDDGDACTANDKCTHDGKCKGAKTDCDDSEPCTVDACDKHTGKCVFANNSGATCEDGNKCTLGDACVGGKCLSGKKKLCDDSLACTTDSCDAKSGQCLFVNNTAPCDDANPCTDKDTCADGKCVGIPHAATACSDGNGCTVDSCDPASGKCAHKDTPAGVLCQDADKCTQGDECAKGVCKSGPPLYCDDNNPCTDDSCDPVSGKCAHKNNAASCDDGNKCTATDTCTAGKCVGGKNACECTKDADCASKEDGNLCNGTLFCEKGVNKCSVNSSTIAVCDKSKDTACAKFSCAPKNGVCEATPTKDGIPCDADGSVCTNGDSCHKGVCKPGNNVKCDDFNPCTDDKCDKDKGCSNTNNTAGCFDGDHCTVNDFCVAGACKSGKPVTKCKDSDPCTADKCNPVTGNCQFSPVSGPACTDSNACTTGDVCVGGGCQPTGTKPPCSDGNPCTIDACDKKTGKCIAKPGFDGLGCDDGNQCSNGDYCLSGKCQPGAVQGCFDGGACKTGKCNVATGKCDYTPTNENGKCNDGNACTLEDICKVGQCVPKDNKPCDDKNVCTADVCNKTTGQCEYTPGTDGLSCNDGDKCSTGDACAKGKCVAKTFTKCDDGNLCTADTCNKATGKCAYKAMPVLPYKPCDDNNKCTRDWWYAKHTGKVGDVCRNGKCFGNKISCSDGNVCTLDSCNAKKGCQHKFRGPIPCNDGNACTTGDSCKTGKCRGAGSKSCNDGNACTTDTCNSKTGCKFTFNKAGCNDGNVCTLTDRCSGGKCTGFNPLNCNDGYQCTKDSCHPSKGCQNVNDDTLACSDNEPCTTGDSCSKGKCQAGKPTVCNDNNECTTDKCEGSVGCKYTDVGDKPCNDNNVCTNPDACKNGKCHSTGLNKCDDGNECTTDSCHPQTGCQNVNFNGTCTDGDACTKGDHCVAGKCKVDGPLSCDDKNVCTTDSCDKKDGCKQVVAQGTSDAKLNLTSDVQTKTYTKTKVFGGKTVPEDIEHAVPADTSHGKWNSKLAGSLWIWRTKTPKDTTADTTVRFLREFKIPTGSTAIKATLKVAADDKFECTLNGKKVSSGSTPDFIYSKDIGSDVVVGDNVLDCAVTNKGKSGTDAKTNPAGILWGLDLDFKLAKITCDDNNKCTALDICELGQCTGSNGLNCNDGNSCTVDKCDAANGCTHTASGGSKCDDGNACTLDDACNGTKCESKKVNNCDDGNLCTDDSCKPIGGCSNDAKKFGAKQKKSYKSSTSTKVTTQKTVGTSGLPVPINLKNAVKFTNGLSTWTSIPGAEWIWHSATLADPTKTETAYFQREFDVPAGVETLRGSLQIAADNAFECFLNGKLVGVSDKNADAYTKATTLNLTAGMKAGTNKLVCAVHNIGKVGDTAKTNAAGLLWRVDLSWFKKGESPACDDGNACTRDDGCIFGFCLGGSPDNCDDDNACTNDACDTKTGCAHVAATNSCNDGSVCTAGDHCSGGKCVGKSQIKCDDGNPCTADNCHKTNGCFGTPMAQGAKCDDDNVCTTDTTCDKGSCKNGKAKTCDDSNPCTTDTCFPLVGCTFKPVDNQKCNDGDSCTEQDICKNGKCLGKKGNSCDDGNNCTADSCTKAGGCTHKAASGAPCSDGNLCTLKDKCQNGVCVSGSSKDCFDTQQCTVDSCDAKTGKCTFSKVSDGECDDGNLCTLNDKCSSGKCKPGPAPGCSDGNTCTTDNCDPSTGKCVHNKTADGTSCDDGNACTLGDRCLDQKCSGSSKDCNDGNECTIDSCKPSNGVCKYSDKTDGNVCQVVGKCKKGACLIK